MDEERYKKLLLCMSLQCNSMIKQVHTMRDDINSLIEDYEREKGERL